jgi:hypothetical protein
MNPVGQAAMGLLPLPNLAGAPQIGGNNWYEDANTSWGSGKYPPGWIIIYDKRTGSSAGTAGSRVINTPMR